MEDSQDNEKLIEEMVLEAEEVAEPGDIVRNPVIHRGDDEVPMPMVATKVTSAGYVKIYDTRTGEVSLTNRNMLRSQLKKVREDGSRVFTTKDPGIRPKRGQYKCLLHPDNPNRAHYDELGLAVCKKDNLTSPFQVKRHMEKRHKVEWATIEEERKQAEVLEQRKFQETLMTKAITGEAPKTRRKKR